MSGLAPIAIGMTGLQFSLFVNGLHLSGVDSEPLDDDSPPPDKTVAFASLVAAIALIFMSFYLLIGTPFGTESPFGAIQIVFSAVSGMYGFLHVLFAGVQYLGLDLRQVGNAALAVGIMQVLFIPVIQQWSGVLGGMHVTIINAVLAVYVVIMVAVWGAVHGRWSPKYAGYSLLVGFVGTFYLLFFASGILPAP